MNFEVDLSVKVEWIRVTKRWKKKVLREASGWHRPQPEPERVEQQQQQQQQRRDGAREGVTIAGPPSHYRAIGALRTAHGKK